MNSAFHARWLASSEVISQVLFTSKQPKKIYHSLLWLISDHYRVNWFPEQTYTCSKQLQIQMAVVFCWKSLSLLTKWLVCNWPHYQFVNIFRCWRHFLSHSPLRSGDHLAVKCTHKSHLTKCMVCISETFVIYKSTKFKGLVFIPKTDKLLLWHLKSKWKTLIDV